MGTATTVTRPTIRDVTRDIARDITVTTTAVRTSAIGTGVTGNRAHAHWFGPLRRRFAAFLRARDCLVTVHVSPARRTKRGVPIFQLLRCERQRHRIFLHMRRRAGFRNRNDAAAADGPG